MRYVALLRGINVGGKNLIKMTDLKTCFEGCGYQSVATYIASGNVLFSAPADPKLERNIEAALEARFAYRANVVLRSAKEMEAVVARAPKGFGTQPAKYRYDVIFLKAPLTGATALKDFPLREGVDQAWAGPGVLYASRLIARASQSRISRIVGLPIYQQMTIRNWNTTTKLATLLED
jgi:uncharacterized protein (DUF1697 family)